MFILNHCFLLFYFFMEFELKTSCVWFSVDKHELMMIWNHLWCRFDFLVYLSWFSYKFVYPTTVYSSSSRFMWLFVPVFSFLIWRPKWKQVKTLLRAMLWSMFWPNYSHLLVWVQVYIILVSLNIKESARLLFFCCSVKCFLWFKIKLLWRQ